jgi:hypothetical protein
MHKECILFYRVCEQYLQQKGFRDDPQARMTTTEVLMTALVAAWGFANNLRAARKALAQSGLVPYMLSESRFNRRWHQIPTDDWQGILTLLAVEYPADTFLVDSCPFAVCHNQRAKRSRLYQDEGGAHSTERAHRFRRKERTDSTRMRAAIPEQNAHGFALA